MATTNTPKTGVPSETQSIRIPNDLWAAVQALAERNERTAAGEVRIAIRKHVEANR